MGMACTSRTLSIGQQKSFGQRIRDELGPRVPDASNRDGRHLDLVLESPGEELSDPAGHLQPLHPGKSILAAPSNDAGWRHGSRQLDRAMARGVGREPGRDHPRATAGGAQRRRT
ncbi:hypothetical protein ACLB2K_026337 [Fragaria x ananassa]